MCSFSGVIRILNLGVLNNDFSGCFVELFLMVHHLYRKHGEAVGILEMEIGFDRSFYIVILLFSLPLFE